VLLDLGLPDVDGLEVLRKLRRVAATPVIVLTARGDERSVVRGLHLGADDYLVKPVRLAELLARIHAVTRRVAPQDEAAVVRVRDLVIDLDARRVRTSDGTGGDIELTAKEFDILTVLARNHGVAVSRQRLLDEVWGDAYLAVSRSLDVHLTGLRAKLSRPGLVTTIRGFGFRLEE
jgi:DNA-binding response OmpR family regulator